MIRIERMTLRLQPGERDPETAGRQAATSIAQALRDRRARLDQLNVEVPAGADIGEAAADALDAQRGRTGR
jgi:hypothetical protein